MAPTISASHVEIRFFGTFSVLQSAKPRSATRRDVEGSLRWGLFVFTVG